MLTLNRTMTESVDRCYLAVVHYPYIDLENRMSQQPDQQQRRDGDAASTPTTIKPGSRAHTTRTLVSKASEKVAERITLEAMQQSFPDFIESDGGDFIRELTASTKQDLQAGFDVRPVWSFVSRYRYRVDGLGCFVLTASMAGLLHAWILQGL